MTDHHVQNPGDDAGGLATPAPDPVGDPPPDLTLRMRSSPRLLAGARELIASLARRLGFDEVSACQVALAVDEALANVIRHGYERREDGPIDMMVWLLAPSGDPAAAPTGLKVVIEDEGRQVDPDLIRGRDLDDIRPGGLGVHIIREVMDEARYEKRIGGGMRLTLVKRAGAVKDGGSPAGNPPAAAAHGRGSVNG